MRLLSWLVGAALALSAAACSSSGGGGSGGGGAGNAGGWGGGGASGGGAGYPTGPMVDCQPGDIDLAASSGPGLSVLAFDPVTLANPVTVMGQQGFESAPIALCVPQDAVSMVLYGDVGQDVLASSFIASGLGEIVDTSSLETVLRFQTPDLMLPKSPEVQLHPGHHVFKLAGNSAGQIAPYLAIRRGQRGTQSAYGLNLILVDGSGIDAGNIQAFADAGTLFDQIYAQVGIAANALGVGFIHDQSLAVLPDTDEHKLTEAQIESSSELPLLPQAINFFFVRELISNDAAGQLLGHAMGIPGVPDLPKKSGVVLSVDAHRKGTELDFGAMWVTAAHEGGHWHGLRHTSERWGTIQDLVSDTPECTPANDSNKDGVVDMAECAGLGAQNLMFWIYDLDHPPTQLTAGQGFALASALIMNPL